MKRVAVFAILVVSFVGYGQQQNNQDPDLSAKKIAGVVVGYSEEYRVGQILLNTP